jgi:hypothetical protein
VAKKTLDYYKNVIGIELGHFIISKDLDELSLMDIQKPVPTTALDKQYLFLTILDTLCQEPKISPECPQ